jgi:hypothetical protein
MLLENCSPSSLSTAKNMKVYNNHAHFLLSSTIKRESTNSFPPPLPRLSHSLFHMSCLTFDDIEVSEVSQEQYEQTQSMNV